MRRKSDNKASVFQFTTSQGGRHWKSVKYYIAWLFQFTTSQGGRRLYHIPANYQLTFNSRPHKEVDALCTFNVSIVFPFQFTTSQGGRHTTRTFPGVIGSFQFTTSQGGRLLILELSLSPDALSIHDLTRRSTGYLLRLLIYDCAFNSRPHKEVDPEPQSPTKTERSFNSRPHKEVDRAVRRQVNPDRSFNSRPHKEVDRKYLQ